MSLEVMIRGMTAEQSGLTSAHYTAEVPVCYPWAVCLSMPQGVALRLCPFICEGFLRKTAGFAYITLFLVSHKWWEHKCIGAFMALVCACLCTCLYAYPIVHVLRITFPQGCFPNSL